MRTPFRSRPAARGIAALWIQMFLVLVLGGAVAACSGDHSGTAVGSTAVPATAGAGQMTMPPSQAPGGMEAAAGGRIPTAEEVAAAWSVRPDYVSHAHQRTQAAYAFAVARPDLLRFLPCYCGCAAMGHLDNLDCFVKPTEGAPVVFEEHASFCDVCVDIALKAQDMLARGQSLVQMRAAVDSEFGGLAPGTPTELPPA